jgi:NADH dehydrogenase
MTGKNPHRVVILGGGFAGLAAGKALAGAPVEVTLVDRRNFHLFQPLLYQVATGSLSPGEISAPLRAVFSRQRNVRVLLGEATGIDADSRHVELADGGRLEYDSLIIATGSETSYFGRDHWRETAPSLKSIEEATAIRHKIFFAFEMAEREAAARPRPAEPSPWLRFVIVGGGATGVELAGALSEIARRTLKDDFRSIRPEEARIILIDAADRVLTTFPPPLSQKAERSLLAMGVEVRKGIKVVEIDGEGLTYERADGSLERVPSKTILWAGGVKGTSLGLSVAEAARAPVDARGRIEVNPDLTVPGRPEIFVLGDIASARQDGRQLPGVAQVAMQGGAFAGKMIAARLRGDSTPKVFRYHDRGDMAVIGRAAAVGKVFGWNVWGWPAWLLWLGLHLAYLVEFQSRVVVFARWAIQYITWARGARLITGRHPSRW